MYKIDRRGEGLKNRSLRQTRFNILLLNATFHDQLQGVSKGLLWKHFSTLTTRFLYFMQSLSYVKAFDLDVK